MITYLEPGQIFVFGSNLAGIHEAGAALYARTHFGAKSGVGEGPTGQCYAIPTKDMDIKTLPLPIIHTHVGRFIQYAFDHPALTFLLTPIGCGLASCKPYQIAPMFKGHGSNVILPDEFRDALK
jgi:hypothetical protein